MVTHYCMLNNSSYQTSYDIAVGASVTAIHGMIPGSKRPRSDMVGVYFIPFPKPKKSPQNCSTWIKLCGNAMISNPAGITRNHYVCSKHFVGVYRGSAIAHQIWPSLVKGGRYRNPKNVKICQKLWFLATGSWHNEHIQMKFWGKPDPLNLKPP